MLGLSRQKVNGAAVNRRGSGIGLVTERIVESHPSRTERHFIGLSRANFWSNKSECHGLEIRALEAIELQLKGRAIVL